jgi:cysteine-rich repeat protein
MKLPTCVAGCILAAALSACALDFGIDKRDTWPEADAPDETSDLVDVERDGTDPAGEDRTEETVGEPDTVEEEVIIPPTCGDGVVDTGEQCDDGNDIDTDACPTTCRNATCGDGFVWEGNEACERDQMLSCTTTCGIVGEGPCSDLCTAPAAEACVPLSGTCCDASQCPPGPDCTVPLCPDGTCQQGPAADLTSCTGGVCCAGVCRPGGECCADNDCRSCRGTAAACSDLSEYMCRNQDGCSVVSNDPYCYDYPSSCSSFTVDNCTACGCDWDDVNLVCSGSSSSCSSHGDSSSCWGCGCTWDFPSCQGPSTVGCGSFSTETACETCDGCYWSYSRCRGSVVCNDISDGATCSGACSCTWVPACEGTARACSSFTSRWSCNNQEGCDWFDTCNDSYVCE